MTHWSGIVQTHGPMVFQTAWRILGHAADAEDVVQDVFLEAHRLHQHQSVDHWRGLLRRLATFRSLDRLRQRRANHSLEESSLIDPRRDPESETIARELEERLRRAIANLPPRESAVFCLRYFEDLTYQQIAEALDVTPGAVATALHKARARLETLLAEPVQGESR